MIYHPIGHSVSQKPINLTHKQKRRPWDRVYRGAAMCGVSSTLSICSGESSTASGSLSYTSSAAPAMQPCCSASTSAG